MSVLLNAKYYTNINYFKILKRTLAVLNAIEVLNDWRLYISLHIICFWIFKGVLLIITFFLWEYICLMIILCDMFLRNCNFAWILLLLLHHDHELSAFYVPSTVLSALYILLHVIYRRSIFLTCILKMRELRQGGDVTCPKSHGKCLSLCLNSRAQLFTAKLWVGIDRYFTTKFTMTNTLWRSCELLMINFYLYVPCGIVERTLDQKSGDLKF